MKAVFIDSKNKTVTDVEIPEKGTLEAWYNKLGCSMVEVAMYINEKDSIIVDEEGLMNIQGDSVFFSFEGNQPLVGNGLIVGSNKIGETISPIVTAYDVREKVLFLSLREVQGQ
jgi:hypothetical protein